MENDNEPDTLRRNHDKLPTSPENRKANTYWKRKRDKWRDEYVIVCSCIRFLKNDVRRMPTREGLTMLRSMQETARKNMEVRATIGDNLKQTAYPYV